MLPGLNPTLVNARLSSGSISLGGGSPNWRVSDEALVLTCDCSTRTLERIHPTVQDVPKVDE